MDLASVFDWLGQDSIRAAEQDFAEAGLAMGGRRATMPWRAIKAATRDAAVYRLVLLLVAFGAEGARGAQTVLPEAPVAIRRRQVTNRYKLAYRVLRSPYSHLSGSTV